MTEQEWLECNDPLKMLHHLRARPAERKPLLLSCACIRRHWDLLSKEGRDWVSFAEDFVESPNSNADIFGDHWDGAIAITGRDFEVTKALDELWSGMYEVDDFNTLTGNRAWDAERREQAVLLREVFGNSFSPAAFDPRWLTSTVIDLAQAIYEERAFDRMPILADALMDAGCDSDEIIQHCRGDGPHVRGCWVVDLLLGKN